MRIAVCHNGTNPAVNYYKITTKLNTLCFKPFQVFYLKSAPVRSGSPDWKVKGQWTRLCWCSNIYCISKVFPLLFWAKLWGRSQQLEPRGKVCSDVSYREESWRVAEGDRPGFETYTAGTKKSALPCVSDDGGQWLPDSRFCLTLWSWSWGLNCGSYHSVLVSFVLDNSQLL